MDEITIFLWRIIGAVIATPIIVAFLIWGIRRWLKSKQPSSPAQERGE